MKPEKNSHQPWVLREDVGKPWKQPQKGVGLSKAGLLQTDSRERLVLRGGFLMRTGDRVGVGQTWSLGRGGWRGCSGAHRLCPSGGGEGLGARPTAASPARLGGVIPHHPHTHLTSLLGVVSEMRPLLRPPAHLHSRLFSQEDGCHEKLNPSGLH